MADARRRRVPRRREDDGEGVGSEEDGENIASHSGAESQSDAESDTIFDKDEDTDEYESAEEEADEVSEPRSRSKPGLDEKDDEEEAIQTSEEEDEGVGEKDKNQEENEEDKTLDADQDLKNPAYIPRRGPYFMHDVRSMEEKDETKEKESRRNEKKLWKDDNKWLHDKYIDEEQAPKPRAEMVEVYGYDIRSSNDPPKTGVSRQRRRSPRGQRRGRRQYEFRESYENRYQRDNRDSYNGNRYEQSKRSEQPPEECSNHNKQLAPTEDDGSRAQNNGEEDRRNHNRDRPWSGRSRGRGRGRGARGQMRESNDRSENAAEPVPIPHKTEWINSSSGSGRRDQAAGQRKDWHHRLPHTDRRQRVPLQEDFPALGAEPVMQELARQPREARSYQRDRPQRAVDKQETARGSGDGDWAGVVAKAGRRNASEDSKPGFVQGDSPPSKSQGLLPTPTSTEGGGEPLEDGVALPERMHGDKREPPKPKRYSSQRQRHPADAPPISQASAILHPPKFYQGDQTGPPPGYQRQGNTPPAASSPQHMGGGATPPHTLQNTAAPVHGGATPPGMGVVQTSQGPPAVITGGVMPQGIILQGDVPLHPGMQHPSPTHIPNPSIIHTAAMRPRPPLPQGSFPPPPHFMVNYGASPGQQYQLNNPPMQQFPQASVPPPPLQPRPIQALPQPNQSLPLPVRPILSQQAPTPVQPIPQGGSASLPAAGPGQPPSQTFGGVTYYSPEQQQQGVKRVQPKRPVNPIRIEEPPQRSKRHSEQYQENQEDSLQQQHQQQQQQHQQQQQQVLEGGTT